MKGFEDLLQLDPAEVAERTYISIDEFKAILNKKFDIFGKSKATGFIKILEREYDLDLSEWMKEFYASKEDETGESDNIFVVPPAESNTIFENKLYLSLIIGSILLFAIFFIFYPDNSANQETMADTSNHIVEEAKQKIEDKNETENSAKLLKKESGDIQEEKTPVKKDKFFISSQTNLWVGIKYLDDNKKESAIIKDGLELDPERDQIITLGHGYFKLQLNDQTIEPKVPNVHKITYKNGKLTVYKIPLTEKNSEKNETGLEEDASQKKGPDNNKTLIQSEE